MPERTARLGREPVPAWPGYPPEYECVLRLPDGRILLIRPIVPTDAPQLAEAIRTADADTLRRRFMGGPPRLTPVLLSRLCTVDYRSRFALVATDASTGEGVAIARYERMAVGAAEVAVVVDPAWRRAGVATALIEMLAQAALERGIHTFTACYLAGNRPVAALRNLAAGAGRLTTDMGIAELVIALDGDRVAAALRELDVSRANVAVPSGRHDRPAPAAGGPAEFAVADAFVEMADTLVEDFDVALHLQNLAEWCVRLLGISAAGILLTDERDKLQIVADLSVRTPLLGLLQTDQGPYMDCLRTGRPVYVPDLPTAGRPGRR